jgi:hypothetical protein
MTQFNQLRLDPLFVEFDQEPAALLRRNRPVETSMEKQVWRQGRMDLVERTGAGGQRGVALRGLSQ